MGDYKHYYDQAGWLSKFTFFWARKYIFECPKDKAPPSKFNIEPNLSKLKSHWEEEKAKSNPSFFKCLFRTFWWSIISSQLGFVIDIFSQISFGIIIGLLIEFIQSENEDKYLGLTYASGTVLCIVISLFARQLSFFNGQISSGIAKQAVLNLIYDKTLRLSHEVVNSGGSTGKIMNLASGDVDSLDMLSMLNFIWLAPIAAIGVSFALFMVIGPVGLVGLGVIMCFAPLQTLVNFMNYKIKALSSGHGDLRLKRTNDVVEGIRVLKMYSWESTYADKINATRGDEVGMNRWRTAIRSCNMSFCLVTEGIASLATFATYVAIYGEVSSSTIFSTLSLMVTAQFYLTLILPFASELIFSYLASCERITTFLLEEEHKKIVQETFPGMVKLDNVTAYWKHPRPGVIDLSEFHLNNINLDLQPGDFASIIGKVGSGKSSLLMTILGEMHIKHGHVSRGGKVAYVEQEPWIVAGTLRENIILNQDFNEDKYRQALENSALKDDVDRLSSGDMTIIGEKGSNISGGQKARLALARALYSDADIYLLDDPLSAVDIKVAKHIFENALLGCLANKTRILVTHQIQFLRPGIKVFKVDNGSVYMLQNNESFSDIQSPISMNIDPVFEKEEKAEELETENIHISFSVYWNYFLKGWWWTLPFIIFLYPAVMLAYISVPYWLVHWSSQSDDMQQDAYYVEILALIILCVIFLALLRNNLMSQTLLSSSKNLHNEVLSRMVKRPISFYDKNSPGRIIGKLSNDVSKTDDMIPWMFTDFMQCLFITLGSVLIMVIGNPWISLLILPMVLALKFIFSHSIDPCHHYYNQMNSSKTPILNHFSEALYGIFSIRCYDLADNLTMSFRRSTLTASVNFFNYHSCMRWMHFNSDSVCAIFIVVNVFASLVMIDFLDRKLVSTGLSLILVLAMDLVWTMFQFSQVQTYMASAERMLQLTKAYTENYSGPCSAFEIRRGEIRYEKVLVRYGESIALNNMTFTIRGGDKVGIVGRTGAGKSSMIQALFRMIELDAGRISIDGVDISTVPLSVLRKALAVIPQSPFIFTASVRYNLDPYGYYTDEEIWSSLQTAHLHTKILSLEGKLDANLNGKSFSAGEKQLLCLARALLKRSQILVMDEATANVDYETDLHIQNAIKTYFSLCTVITIAHRLDTVIRSNVVMVIDAGCCVEIGSPGHLLKDNKSKFFAMVENSGEQALKTFQKAAIAQEIGMGKLVNT